MVFPSTQVEFRAARLPWLSASLVFASLWVLLAIPAPQFVPEPDSKAALETAFRYWQTHGYLTPDERIIEAADSHFELRTDRKSVV